MLKPDPPELPWTRPSPPPQKSPGKGGLLRQAGRAPSPALPLLLGCSQEESDFQAPASL